MFGRKPLSLGVLLAVLVIAMVLLGVGYGLWSKTLTIGGTVDTGEVDAEFVLGAITEEDHGKEVGDCAATLVDPGTLQVTVANGYPSYECTVDFAVRNPGSIPIHIYRPNWTDLPPSNEVTVEVTACYDDDTQLHTGETSDNCSLHIHVEQDAGQNATYTFAANVDARQFNEPRTALACDETALIDAINSANINAGPDVIDLDGSCTYTLTAVDNNADGPNGLPSVTSNITINGNGAIIERAGGAPNFRIFHVASGGDLTLNDMTVRGGYLYDYAGGGIYTPSGSLTLYGVTVSDNTAQFGGGIGAFNATVTVTNSTISGNRAEGPQVNNGGGIYQNGIDATLDLLNVTITGNHAETDGGGLRFAWGTLTFQNSIIAHNTDVGGNYPNCAYHSEATWTSLGYNLSSDAQSGCRLYGPGDQWGVPAMLGPLADNGGPTWTHALLTGSPAIDAVLAGCPPPGTDQRGVARPQGPFCDIGAFELEVP